MPDNTTCGSENFMMRDSVCDDPSNIAKCFYDGGDCCLENKDTTLCRNCTCILHVDHDDLNRQFGELKIKPLKPNAFDTISGVEVENVISLTVCAVLCLDHDLANNFNYWHYFEAQKLCRCGWIDARLCPEKMTIPNWTFSNATSIMSMSNSFVQLKKTLPCGIKLHTFK